MSEETAVNSREVGAAYIGVSDVHLVESAEGVVAQHTHDTGERQCLGHDGIGGHGQHQVDHQLGCLLLVSHDLRHLG